MKLGYIFEIIKLFLIAFLLVWIVNNFIFAAYNVKGDSMLPTLENGDKLIVNIFGYKFDKVEHGDIIIFNYEKDKYIKRIIGLPGDTLEYKEDQLYVNSVPVPESYLTEQRFFLGDYPLMSDFTLEDVTGFKVIPKNKIFVLGDNRVNSLDSRELGFIDSSSVIGKASFKYWPLYSLSVIK